MRIVLLDWSLVSETGHHFNVDRALAEASDAVGIPTVVFAHRKVESSVVSLLDCVPHFSCSSYHRYSADPHCGDIEDFMVLNNTTLQDLSKLPIKLAPSDVVIVPTLNHNQLSGLAQWYANLPIAPRPVLIVWLMFSAVRQPTGTRSGIDRQLYSFGLKQLLHSDGARVVLCAESAHLASEYQELTGYPVATLPLPTIPLSHLSRGGAPISRPKSRITFIGYGSRERGFHLLPEIVRRVLAARPSCEFHVQANFHGEDQGVVEAARALEGMKDGISLSFGKLSADEYFHRLWNTDLVLVPYDRQAYCERGSGVFGEAMSMGNPVVVPQGTWMADTALSAGTGEVFEAFEPASIANATAKALDRLGVLRDNATAAARQWSHERAAPRILHQALTLAGAL